MEPIVFTLAKVSELTGWAEITLLRDCKAGRIEHVHRGNSYGMTREQIHELVAKHTVTTTAKPTAREVEEAELDAIRQATAKRVAKRGAA
jgi:hypothetical protein